MGPSITTPSSFVVGKVGLPVGASFGVDDVWVPDDDVGGRGCEMVVNVVDEFPRDSIPFDVEGYVGKCCTGLV